MRGFLRLQTTVTVAMAWILAATGGAVAAVPGGNGKIAYESNRAGGFDLYTVEADGTGISVLVAMTGWDRAPAWSPDGSRVAFQSNLLGDFDIWIINADGSGLRTLTSHPENEIQPVWSPDGTRIAFARLDPGFGTHDIWDVSSDDGSGERNLTDDPGNDIRPAWSPDGSRIAFESDRDGNAEIYVVGVGDPPASAVNLTGDVFEDTDPAWSPDGTRIAFVSDRDIFSPQIWTMNPDGSSPTVVSGTEPGDRDPAFSPDGTSIAFTRNGAGGIEGIWRVALDGSGLAMLDEAPPFTRTADWQSVPAAPENSAPVAYAGPDGQIDCVPPDGTTVHLDGTGSSDPDSTTGSNDDIVSFEWFLAFGTQDERRIAEGAVADVLLPPGTHVVTLRVTDQGGLSDVDDAVWTLVEGEPASLSVEVTPSVLWPPNHRLVPVHATVTVAGGSCGESSSAILVSVESDEPDDAKGLEDGRTSGDVAGAEYGTADVDVLLRAERDGNGPGRTYLLTWAVPDGRGGESRASATVFVPHDEPDAPPPAESGERGAASPPRPRSASTAIRFLR